MIGFLVLIASSLFLLFTSRFLELNYAHWPFFLYFISQEKISIPIFVLLNFADLHGTNLVICRGGTESNPLLKPILKRFGMRGIISTKLLFTAVFGTLFLYMDASSRVSGLIYFALISCWNYFLVFMLGITKSR